MHCLSLIPFAWAQGSAKRMALRTKMRKPNSTRLRSGRFGSPRIIKIGAPLFAPARVDSGRCGSTKFGAHLASPARTSARTKCTPVVPAPARPGLARVARRNFGGFLKQRWGVGKPASRPKRGTSSQHGLASSFLRLGAARSGSRAHGAHLLWLGLALFGLVRLEQEHDALLFEGARRAHSPHPCFAQLSVEQAPHIG